MDQPSTWLLTVGHDGRIIATNPAACEALGNVAGRRCSDVMRVLDPQGKTDCSTDCAAAMIEGETQQNSRQGRVARRMTGRVVCDQVGDQVVVSVQPIRSGQELPAASLSPREREILKLIGRGMTNAVIGRHLKIAPSTVRTHLEHACEKLGARGRAAAVAKAIATGELELE